MKIPYLLTAIIGSLLLFSCKGPEVKSPPNIILLISDDQSWPHYSFLGHEHIQTPRIDQLAEKHPEMVTKLSRQVEEWWKKN